MVHLPLVALPLAVLFDAMAARSRHLVWRDTATVLWWLGLLGAVMAVGTGLAAYARVDHSEVAHVRMTLHRNLALGTLALLAVTSILRWWQPYGWGSLILGAVGVGGLVGVGNLGGELVYRHGVGLPTVVVEEVLRERGGHVHDTHPGKHASVEGDSVGGLRDTPPVTEGNPAPSTAPTHDHHDE